jgi:hypothetical protein
MFASEHEPLALLVELTPKLAKNDLEMIYTKPGIINVATVMVMQQALITSFHALSLVFLSAII